MGKKRDEFRTDDLLHRNTRFQIIEAYKNLRTNLLFSLSTSESHTVVITSSEPNAGKSYTCANLAITMAQTGSRVLVIDADMRKPRLHKIFGVSNEVGLSTILSGEAEELKNVLHTKVAPDVNFISSGAIPPNPSELLGHARMHALLDAVSQAYDYAFIDTPPVNVVSDSMLLMKQTAGVLIVTRQRQTTFDEAQRTVDKYKNFDAPILGLVVTDVKPNVRGYGQHGAYDYEYR
jgi:capsular exopolysaccharide synthesis family protein